MPVPPEYHGREQTYLKHRVLREYVEGWGHKLASAARHRAVRLWFVDCFSGPWKSQHEALEDTSIAIGLTALEDAAATWSDADHDIHVHAIFIEPDHEAFGRLTEYLGRRDSIVATFPRHGEFGAFVPEIGRLVGTDPAFLFVDPTGWKGAAMRHIAPLMGPRRDVLVNVMFNHVNRFKDDPRVFLRDQLRDFFGLDEALPADLSEEAMMQLYRAQLKQRCGVNLAADLAIPHPVHERTWFRLVVGSNVPAAIDLFREIERRVVGAEAAEVRDDAARRTRERLTSQTEMSLGVPLFDRGYEDLRQRGLDSIDEGVTRMLDGRSLRFADIWPPLLEAHHITKSDVAARTSQLIRSGVLMAQGMGLRERVVKDPHVLSIAARHGAYPGKR